MYGGDKCIVCSSEITDKKSEISVFTDLNYSHLTIISRLEDLIRPYPISVASDIICLTCYKLFDDLETCEEEVNKAKSNLLEAFKYGRKLAQSGKRKQSKQNVNKDKKQKKVGDKHVERGSIENNDDRETIDFSCIVVSPLLLK